MTRNRTLLSKSVKDARSSRRGRARHSLVASKRREKIRSAFPYLTVLMMLLVVGSSAIRYFEVFFATSSEKLEVTYYFSNATVASFGTWRVDVHVVKVPEGVTRVFFPTLAEKLATMPHLSNVPLVPFCLSCAQGSNPDTVIVPSVVTSLLRVLAVSWVELVTAVDLTKLWLASQYAGGKWTPWKAARKGWTQRMRVKDALAALVLPRVLLGLSHILRIFPFRLVRPDVGLILRLPTVGILWTLLFLIIAVYVTLLSKTSRWNFFGLSVWRAHEVPITSPDTSRPRKTAKWTPS